MSIIVRRYGRPASNSPPKKRKVPAAFRFRTLLSAADTLGSQTNVRIKGHALGLKIAADNVPNFVDLTTGGWAEAIQSDPIV